MVHAGDSIDDLIRFTNEARGGDLPSNPYLVIGQQSLLDPTRAPAGGHTLWAYSRVPSTWARGWDQVQERFADRIEARIEGLAPGFRALIRGRAIFAPPDLERMNELQYFSADDPDYAHGFRTILATESVHAYVANWWPPGHIIGYEHEFTHAVVDFVQAIETKSSIAANFADGLAEIKVLEAGLRSAETGQRIDLD